MNLSRDSLLQEQKEKDEAIKEAMQKYKDVASIKYNLFNENGSEAGFLEYSPKTDSVMIGIPGEQKTIIAGKVLKSLRNVLNKLLDE
jgi:hypothetical protein